MEIPNYLEICLGGPPQEPPGDSIGVQLNPLGANQNYPPLAAIQVVRVVDGYR